MITTLVSTFLFVHGLLHLTVWLPHGTTEQPVNPRYSWVLASAGLPQARDGGAPGRAKSRLGESRAAVALASVTTMLYVIAGAATAAQSSGWTAAAVLAASVGLVLKSLWFNPWLSLGVLLDAAVIAAVATSWPGSLY
ncbi:hypothetical protein SAMN04487981_105204 [Streptomyces sp. cf386]|uniref:hypothetical protein n=1 Tax=Streptomyces sp. cf386 TaxID=1761904 RepID=UPI0008843E65|nr:hypothetical protein [Streptomyces sp. cf386]SDN48311.1 hypothetical protein SAMN04487981_105204 [Streptomyces sp. cf386]